MKLLLSALLLSSYFGYSQIAMPFEQARKEGISPKVDSIYKSAFDGREGYPSVFKKKEDIDRHTNAYRGYLKGLGEFLNQNGFKWEETTKGFNRIYIQPDGTIDYFLYSFKNLSADKEKEFGRLLNLYIKDHKFGNPAPEKFAQCSPVTYPKSV
ncbi:MAG: hypothetical protein DI539_04590 [Flavobacterium psychrophilum]|nr:MAG: hypothetical protein DI539_04590 [Flavobacterium psychrophilum]